MAAAAQSAAAATIRCFGPQMPGAARNGGVPTDPSRDKVVASYVFGRTRTLSGRTGIERRVGRFMPGQMAQPQDEVRGKRSGGDFHAYIARNLSDAYRLAVMTLDDPTEAVAVVHDAVTAMWRSAGGSSDRDLDRALRQRLEAGLHSALKAQRSGADALALDPLDAAIAGLNPKFQVELARSFGPWESAAPVGASWASLGGDAQEAFAALRLRLDAPDAPAVKAGDPEPALRALYERRDPGEPAPLQLRLRLQQEDRDAEAASERSGEARPTGWGFVLNTFMALVVLVLVLALASVINVRSSAVVNADPTSDPTSPLTISAVTTIQVGIDNGDVQVGSTQRTLLAAFAPSAQWHLSAQQCLADVFGTIDWRGNATWGGQPAGHADFIAGDPSSPSAYVAGEGSYCEVGQHVSLDGGATWSAGSLPGDPGSSPTWIGFDPAHAHTLLVYYPGALYESSDSGSTWTAYKSTVAPIAFDSTGRLVGWSSGSLYQSLDEGASWEATNPGPTRQPLAAGASADGVLIGTGNGLWWYPLTSAPSEVYSGSVYSIATLAQGAVVLGADAAGHPWVGTVDAVQPGISLATLPPDVASMRISGGGAAVNDSGAILAFSGSSSVIAFAAFAH